ncbi:MAG: hypothetical protein ACI8VC_001874 [Candidatus Endobugula sp.]|jgi:hypothetical protein
MFNYAITEKAAPAQRWPRERSECFGSPCAHGSRASLHILDVRLLHSEGGQATATTMNSQLAARGVL